MKACSSKVVSGKINGELTAVVSRIVMNVSHRVSISAAMEAKKRRFGAKIL